MKKILFIFALITSTAVFAEDGSNLWLRQNAVNKAATISISAKGASAKIAYNELAKYWQGGKISIKTDKNLQAEEFTIIGNKSNLTIKGGDDAAVMYAAYHLLRLQTMGNIGQLNIKEKPTYKLRILNHWDNPDGTVERGFAGHSIWQWDSLPGRLSPKYEEYARANASVGINATVLNNVNTSPMTLSTDNLKKVKALADVFRPYHIKVFLSVNFATPIQLGGLKTADPLNKEVIAWWQNKAKEIYRLIPDFGGFLVKASSEGQPGPGDFGRTHADGANMLADAVKPYGGIIMWRAFVYNASDKDRAKQAYLEFVPLDGKFHDNVIIQIKNGPVDFQPREPYSPLFGAMPHTKEMLEVQITQEYLGAANHLVYLAPLYKECLDNIKNNIIAIAGVANIGNDKNWTGHHFAAANWYAFGRLCWNPNTSSDEIAKEWLAQTFTNDSNFIGPVAKLMTQSREAAVDYMMPLGLHHIFAGGHHYGPEPWYTVPGIRPDWTPKYYHRADSIGLGFDRTSTGTDAVGQYPEPLLSTLENIKTCPEKYILWFHHVTWNHKMHSGRTLWDELCWHYQHGLDKVREFQKIWDEQEKYVDAERFKAVQSKLKIQTHDAQWWKDACLLYFQQFSKMQIPLYIERPVYDLDYLMKVKLPIDNYQNPTREMLP